MFDGSFKSRRTINLGGNKQQIDKQKLLKQAQEERRIREAERARLKAAERIQAWYRGRTVAAGVRQDIRDTWDMETTTLQHIIGSTAQLTPTTIEQLSSAAQSSVQKLLIFFRPRLDHQRMVQLCSNLLLTTGASKTRLIAIPFQSTPDQQASWQRLVGRLLPVLVQHLGAYSSWSEQEAEPVFTLFDTLTLMETYPTTQDTQMLSKHFSQILSSVDIFPQLARFLSRISIGEKSNPSFGKALLLAVRILRASEQALGRVETTDQFVSYILTVPLLPNRMPIETLSTFTSRLPLDNILLQLSGTSLATITSLPQYKAIPLLANILAFGYQRVAKMSPAVSNAYLHVLTALLGLVPRDSIESASKRAADDDEDMDDIEWRSENLPGSSPKSPSSSTAKLDPRMMKWLSLAYDSNHLNDILGSIEKSSPVATTPTGATQDVLSADSIGEITHLLLNLITLFPSHKINILSNLMYFKFGSKTKTIAGSGTAQGSSGKVFSVSIIKIFLDAFTSTKLYDQLLQSMQRDTPLSVQLVMDQSHAKAWNLLAFIAELYCQILVTMGDDEFYDETRNPIGLQSVVTLASVVRDVAFLLWWNDNALNMESNVGGSMDLKVGYLRDIVTKLTRQLHARDSRKAFCPKDHWLLSMPLDMNAFKRAVIQDEENLSRDQEVDEHDGDDAIMTDSEHVRVQRSINRRQRTSQLARLSPRLGVLNNIPFVIRFEDRVLIFRAFVESDRQRSPGMSGFHPHPIGQAQIHRGTVFEDGYEHLNHLGPKLKGRIAISFVDQHGIPEAGIDGGGVFKEFLTSLVLQAFNTNYGLFMNTSDHFLYPNPHRFAQERTQLKHYEFLGRILGKALYEGILIDAAFAGFFLSKCLGQVNYLDDLPSLDPELYRGLMFLKNYEGNFEDLSLYFTVDDEEMGQTVTRELIPNGANTIVTRENRIRYIYLTAHYRLNTQIDRQCKAFFRGLSDLIDPKWLWMFNQQELQVMMGGAQTGISLKDLAQNVVYSNFERTDPTIEYFWSVVEEMSEEDRRLLVKFVTSCARPPLMGFAELNPKLCIRNAGREEDRLPTSSTCMNLLKLPAFTSRERLKEKLLYAIHSEAGFDLS
ncbi:hypothetical protein EC957_002436 [Mortierella hygrophila]|uniref:HECT-type E3 ubiquitin transferase n=1 Tax=Mortierella hygrophila TaxID=979708 RepID=A0A9P6K7D7_9FUNG|nr:hypothetical protein EC957_002436 [Mortierella hygrophila]